MISIPENQIIPEYENISECQINPECKFITRKEKFSNEINKLLHNYDNITTRQEKIENTMRSMQFCGHIKKDGELKVLEKRFLVIKI